jgi:phage shock protein A
MVIFAVIGVVGLGLAIWFYQQGKLLGGAIDANQQAFRQTVGKAFTESGWSLPTEPSSEFGVAYADAAYRDVVKKLSEAADYEKKVQPLLGWESIEGFETALAGSALQKEAQAQGKATYPTLRGLVEQYERSYGALSQQVADLSKRNEQLTQGLDDARKDFLAQQEKLQDTLNQAKLADNKELATLRAENDKLQKGQASQRQAAQDWLDKYQKEVDGRRTDVTGLQKQVAFWRKKYDDEVAGPGERERLVAQGEVLQVYPEHDFVMIEGGKDRDLKPTDTFIVYSATPDGKGLRKGVLLVGQVYEHTSLASISEEDTLIVQGDYFVSLARWIQFHREATAQNTGG